MPRCGWAKSNSADPLILSLSKDHRGAEDGRGVSLPFLLPGESRNENGLSIRGIEEPLSWEEKDAEYGSVSIPQEAFIAALRMGEE